MSKNTFVKVSIKELTFDTIIGILDFERVKKQKVIVNCSFKYKYKNNNFVDYSKVANDIKTTMIKENFELIEDALNFLNKKIKKRYKIKNLKLKIAKPNILKDCCVEVALTQ